MLYRRKTILTATTSNPTTIIARTASTSGAGSISSVTENSITSAITPFTKKLTGCEGLSMRALIEFNHDPSIRVSAHVVACPIEPPRVDGV